jgi:hypothetical protein
MFYVSSIDFIRLLLALTVIVENILTIGFVSSAATMLPGSDPRCASQQTESKVGYLGLQRAAMCHMEWRSTAVEIQMSQPWK